MIETIRERDGFEFQYTLYPDHTFDVYELTHDVLLLNKAKKLPMIGELVDMMREAIDYFSDDYFKLDGCWLDGNNKFHVHFLTTNDAEEPLEVVVALPSSNDVSIFDVFKRIDALCVLPNIIVFDRNDDFHLKCSYWA